jgi:hypothetical protein
MSNEYKQFKKILKLFRVLYDQKKSFLLWLRILIDKCIKFELNSIFNQFCLFSNDNEILMFFYVNDIVFALTTSREKDAENLIHWLKDIFDITSRNGSVRFDFGSVFATSISNLQEIESKSIRFDLVRFLTDSESKTKSTKSFWSDLLNA